ncbi:MAG: alpha/beta hydrolase [Deltaproteobacteria bacterium]|nr:alpha/beta hydrolase [Deltaproteobacteria bacterium]
MSLSPTEITYRHADTDLYAVEHGDGPPVVLLHGGLATHLACLAFAAPLAAAHRLVTPDLRASGRSRARGPLGWDLFADDVLALLDHLGLARAIVGGVSFGSGVAARFALRHPDRLAGLVLLTPVYPGADTPLDPAARAAMDAMAAAGRRALTEGPAALHPLLAALPPDVQARARALFDTYDPESVAALTTFMASGAQPFASAADLADITAPTLLVPGADPTHPRWVAALYAQHLRDARVRDAEPGAWADLIAEAARAWSSCQLS